MKKREWKKRWIGILLSCVMTASLAACGGGGGMDTKEDVNQVPEDTYEIEWYTRATAQNDVATVEKAVNEYLKDKINATLKIHILDAAQYSKKVTTMIAAGEKFDLIYCGSGVLNYADSVRKDVLFDMAPYLDEYMPGIKAQMDEEFLKTVYVEDKIGGIPALKELGAEWGWYYRKDIADKYGIDMTKIKTLEELEPYLLKIKAEEPSIEYPMEWDTTVSPQSLLSYTMVSNDCAIYLDNGVPRDEVVSFPESPEFMQLCRTTRRYYEEGLVKPDVLTASDANERLKTGKAFVTIGSLKPGAVEEKFPNAEYPLAQAGYAPITQNKGTASMIGLSSTSENPYRVMRFLELLYTDPVLSNMIVYGVEGVHYNKNGDGYVEQIQNSGYDLYTYQYMLGNIFMNDLRVGEDPQKHEKLKAFNEEAVPNIANGFYPDNSSYELEEVAVQGVQKEYRNQAVLGALDPDEIVPKYIAKLKEAGMDKMLTEIQKQYQEFLKNNQ